MVGRKSTHQELNGIEICAFHFIAARVVFLLKAFVLDILSLHIYSIGSEYKQIVASEMLPYVLRVIAGGW